MQLLVDCSGTTSRHWKGKTNKALRTLLNADGLPRLQVPADLSFGGRNSYCEPGLLGVPGGLATQLKLGSPLCNRHKARVCAHDLFSLRPNGFIALLQI